MDRKYQKRVPRLVILIVKIGQLRVGIIDGSVAVKIELENRSTIETLESEDKPIRGKRANINPWCYDFERPGISDEKLDEVLEPFMVNNSPDFKREYDCIWCSSRKENNKGDCNG